MDCKGNSKSVTDKTQFILKKGIPDNTPKPEPSSDYAKVNIPVGTSVPSCEESNSCYNPFEVRVKKYGTVEWLNVDTAAHTVTGGTPSNGPSGVFDSSLLMAGASFSHTFDRSGVYDYFCMVHPWMQGTILVASKPSSSSIVVTTDKTSYGHNDMIQVKDQSSATTQRYASHLPNCITALFPLSVSPTKNGK